jgi:uncharacterized OsmC-like protein
MANDMTATTVTSTSTEVYGRTINTARHNHFVIDSPNGPGEALSTGEAFLAGIAACGVTLVQGAAATENIAIDRLSVDVTSFRAAANPVDFDHIDVEFTYTGPTFDQAETLTQIWKSR